MSPMRFAADGIDLFAWKQSGRVIIVDESGGSTLLAHEREAHLCIPILHLAGIGYDVIRNLNKVGKANYAPPGGESLNFELCGSEVCIRGTINMTEIKVGYQELLNAFEAYRASVRVFLNERVPKLRLHSHWGAWLEVCP